MTMPASAPENVETPATAAAETETARRARRLLRRRPSLLDRLPPRSRLARALLVLAFGLVLGGIVHIVSVLSLPLFAERDAFARLSAIAEPNTVTLLDDPGPAGAVLPASDPAFVSAVCLYDLAEGPMKLVLPTTPDYTSVSFYTRSGLAFYAINDRAAGRQVIELDLMNARQKAELPDNDEVTAADQLIVESPTDEGIVLMRALVGEPSARDLVRQRMAAARCEVSGG
ncbi:DUF1254 domain-containing protein [Ancylobacter sp. 6x-1]|uniref:DUF1254 domain-containing protein n=1 Tax=Ancylobacter crimeensis TaxID=2579147 RepID=A0ABT0D8V4_9HYPH|nr:DUF1254 domain-containing protein [Ancylobacter crimeensis]MCK0196370.1 DUF1254 domain-containing protein [Ancylobacter crimeensis]